jgi:hypothetical protein
MERRDREQQLQAILELVYLIEIQLKEILREESSVAPIWEELEAENLTEIPPSIH